MADDDSLRGTLLEWSGCGRSGSLGRCWLCLFAAPIVTLQFPYIQRVERIRQKPRTVLGAFTAKNCAHHASRSFEFQVDGKTYHGGGASEAGGDCDKIQIGAPITIYYEYANPTNNIGVEPAAELLNEIISVGLVALFFPPILIWNFRRWRSSQITH